VRGAPTRATEAKTQIGDLKKRGNPVHKPGPDIVAATFSFHISHPGIAIMASKNVDVPELGFWEKADVPFAQLTVAVNALLATLTGVFRGQASPKKYSHHIMAAAIRRMCDRTSDLQKQYVPSNSREMDLGKAHWIGMEMEKTRNDRRS
jgi:hypothetical protein